MSHVSAYCSKVIPHISSHMLGIFEVDGWIYSIYMCMFGFSAFLAVWYQLGHSLLTCILLLFVSSEPLLALPLSGSDHL